jgi:hypothetical protein
MPWTHGDLQQPGTFCLPSSDGSNQLHALAASIPEETTLNTHWEGRSMVPEIILEVITENSCLMVHKASVNIQKSLRVERVKCVYIIEKSWKKNGVNTHILPNFHMIACLLHGERLRTLQVFTFTFLLISFTIKRCGADVGTSASVIRILARRSVTSHDISYNVPRSIHSHFSYFPNSSLSLFTL